MRPVRRRPPFAADERTQLVGWLDLQRAVVQLKCEGLSDADAYRPVLPGSPLMTMAGAVSHLRWILVHMVEETARHAGHMDAIRELLKGEKGY